MRRPIRPGRLARGRPRAGLAVAAVLVGGAAYGACMGSYAGRPVQVIYSATKVPILIGLTAALALPGFFVLNTLLGLRADWPRALRAVARSQAAVAVSLGSLAPLVLVWYSAGVRYHAATLFSGGAFLLASLAAQWRLRRAYRPLIARDRRHRLMLAAWLGVYVFVGIQLAWVLRPFVGDPAAPPAFFREGEWGNAYVALAGVVRGAVR